MTSFPHLPPPFPPPPPPPPPSSASSTAVDQTSILSSLSTLTSLISHSTSILNSLPLPLPLPLLLPTSPTSTLPCPFNPNHHLPPSSLFSHYLKCPSSPSPLNPTSLLSSLHYPHTLTPPPPSKIPTPPTDLTIPLKKYINFTPNLFYSNCPGAVTFNQNKPVPDLILPMVLSAECADFDGTNVGEVRGLSTDCANFDGDVRVSSAECADFDGTNVNCDVRVLSAEYESDINLGDVRVLSAECADLDGNDVNVGDVKVLPAECADFDGSDGNVVGDVRVLSAECADFDGTDAKVGEVRVLGSESWGIRNEIGMWEDFPGEYSYCVGRGFLLMDRCGLGDLMVWVVASSVRFGLVVDLALADHVVLIIRLCLKAIVREAFGLVNNESKERGLSGRRFSCPVLSRVLMWLGSQLGILYGEGNGKSFAINIIRQCLTRSLCSNSFFSLKNGANRSEDLGVGINCEKASTIYRENVEKCSAGGKIRSSVVFVSQVAASIAALHERRMLEEKIRALWDSRPCSSYQRGLEHKYICMTADIERQKRPNYRPLIEHDGLFRQQSHGQDSNRTKTREEILAEERDYKRRRTSYRGKKGKRSTTEVMRDIIKEHMEELRHANEMECSVKNVEDKQDLDSITYTGHDNSINMYQQTKSLDFSSKLGRGQQHNYGELSGSHARHLVDQQSRHQEEDHSESLRRRRSRYERSDSSRSPNKRRHKYKRDISSTPDGQRSKRDAKYSSRSPNRKLSRRHRHVSDEQIQDETLISGISSHVSEKSHRKTSERNSHQREDREHKLEVRNRSRVKTHQRYKSASESNDRYDSSVEYNKFEDRYDPSESYDA